MLGHDSVPLFRRLDRCEVLRSLEANMHVRKEHASAVDALSHLVEHLPVIMDKLQEDRVQALFTRVVLA